MTAKQIHLIAAARPNFMKIAPLYHALCKENWARPAIVHTGQHYDKNLSDIFFRDLGLPDPHFHLGQGGSTQAEQTARIIVGYEKLLLETKPDLVVVPGDVTSTMAATLAAVKLGIPVGHLEAGLRSYDRSMPEEINRIVTDALSALLWTPSLDADENLLREGCAPETIVNVGNIMLDSLELLRPKFDSRAAAAKLGLTEGNYALVTAHRPSNVDNAETLKLLAALLKQIAQLLPVVFPLHPRTRKGLENCGLLAELSQLPGLKLTEPLAYIEFMSLLLTAKFMLTDSGGIQEETTYLGVPCFTLRENTERPITISQGTNRLVNFDTAYAAVAKVLTAPKPTYRPPALWDGKTAARVVKSIGAFLKV